MTFAEKVKNDALESLNNETTEQLAGFDFANDDERHCLEELADLSLKLGAMVGKVANVIENIPCAHLLAYLHNEMTWSALTVTDINRDYAKYSFDDEEDEDEDEDDDVEIKMGVLTHDEIKEIIEDVLKELRDR